MWSVPALGYLVQYLLTRYSRHFHVASLSPPSCLILFILQPGGLDPGDQAFLQKRTYL